MTHNTATATGSETTETTETDLEEERRLQARLAANLDSADRALKEATRTPTVKCSTGQPKPNPLFEVASRFDELALRFRAALEELREKRAQAAELERLRELTTR
jgi:hypothetical protein